MSDFAATMKKLRIERGMTQDQLARMLKISRSAVGMYEAGKREPDFETCEAIADTFNVDMDYLMGRSNIERKSPVTLVAVIPPGFQPMPELSTVPVVGRIACGTPILAEQNIECEVCVPSRWRASFALVCKGNSMEPKIHDGDLVAIRKQPEVENGEVAAVRIGEEATLKRVFRHENMLELRAENPSFPSIILVGADMETVMIEDKAVGLCRDI